MDYLLWYFICHWIAGLLKEAHHCCPHLVYHKQKEDSLNSQCDPLHSYQYHMFMPEWQEHQPWWTILWNFKMFQTHDHSNFYGCIWIWNSVALLYDQIKMESIWESLILHYRTLNEYLPFPLLKLFSFLLLFFFFWLKICLYSLSSICSVKMF